MVDVEWAVRQLEEVYKVEEQFRFSLAAELVRMYGPDRVEVEWEVGGNRIDIIVRRNDVTIPIELKYLTDGDHVQDNRFDESYNLGKNHDSNRFHYHIINDIERVESVVSDQGEHGYFVLLTNISSIWSEPSQAALHDEFRVNEGAVQQGTIQWPETSEWMVEDGLDEPIELTGKYQMDWTDFTYHDDIHVSGSPRFRCLVLRVD